MDRARTTTEQRVFAGLPYTLVRSGRRKTAAILVEPSGEITVRVPHDLPEAAIEDLLQARRARLLAAVAEKGETRTSTSRQYRDGEAIPFLGTDYPLRLHDQSDEALTFDGCSFHLRRADGVGAVASYQDAFRRFYTEAGRDDLPKRVARWAPRLAVEPTAVRVLDLRNRWASCSPKGAVNFHWRAMMAPAAVLDYLVVHELAHLRVPDHSRPFWRLVDEVLPDHAERHDWLRVHGAEMDL